eukprot:CAMPEP_0196782550 /NCGR_PEP_ID=MMETSP1104-20130614/11592_1 /TAXON_ID=33652 /ORGANISM="Cafeteria sp., Strain Caron Lab Isolate" /LENGTH=120 /DNA_ID=CAMNT_0042152789 /DNA_START=1 /DNA_END=363 /DNA_ORIENTATION=+
MDFDADEAEFLHDEVVSIVKNVIEDKLKSVVYDPKKLPDYSASVIDAVLKGLLDMSKPFKYVVTCIILQKTGSGLHTAATCFWDGKTDGYCKVPWENSTMHCIVTVYGMAIMPSPQPGEP